MDVTVKIKRYDPESNNSDYVWQEYPIAIDENATVLDALIQIREDDDGTLSLRCSCRSAICGSCAMKINGQGGLACKTKASESMDKDGVILVEPAGNMDTVKDLVADFDMFWNKIREIEPYLQPQGEIPEGEYVVSNESMLHLSAVTACILCGACVSDCTVLEVDKSFLGPAALAKAYRFTADPRDGDEHGVSRDRLKVLGQPSGMWDCTRCNMCVQVCPKGVAPMDRIMAMHDQAIEAGYGNNNGARHADAFIESVGHTGRLDELRLPVKTVGITNIPALLAFAPVGWRAMTHGKLPPLIHKSVEDVQTIRKLYRRLEQ